MPEATRIETIRASDRPRRPAPMIGDLIEWQTFPLDVCPFEEMWGFNPSVCRRTDGRWIASVRCASYSMKGGTARFASWVDPGVTVNRNVMLTLDPASFRPTSVIEMCELDDRAKPYTKCIGYEDLRLVEMNGRMHAVATAMQLSRTGKQEIVLLDLDDDYQIVGSQPLRGSWSDAHQKNWTPYLDHPQAEAGDPLLVFSLERGQLHDRQGIALASHPAVAPQETPDLPEHLMQAWIGKERATGLQRQLRAPGAMEVRLAPQHPRMARPGNGTKRIDTFPLRGGSQLVPLPEDALYQLACMRFPMTDRAWLGIGHGMRIIGGFKFYWHVLYTMDDCGRMTGRSRPFKLADTGIEFCAGLAIDPSTSALPFGRAARPDASALAPAQPREPRIVCSFGIDDHDAMIGIAPLSQALSLIEPLDEPPSKDSSTCL